MSAPIGPGDWVEAVEGGGRGEGAQVGGVYQIRTIEPGADFGDCELHGPECAHDACTLVECPSDEYCVGAFRPIYRPKSELLRDLLKPVAEDA